MTALWVATALLLAPLSSAFAALSTVEAPPAAHVSAGAPHAAAHADHGKAPSAASAAVQKGVSCDQHDHGSGHCCAQCVTVTSVMPTIFFTTHAPRLSAVPYLRDRLVAAGHDRPPAV